MVAQKEHINIRPTGAFALHKLGLTTQVPTTRVYLTDGNPRQFKLGKLTIRFKRTTAKKLATKGPISSLVLQVVEELEPAQIPPNIAVKLRDFLQREEKENLDYDLRLASGKVYDYIVRLLQ